MRLCDGYTRHWIWFWFSWFLHELEVFICKAFKGDDVLLLLQVLNNERRWKRGPKGHGNLKLALKVKINEKNRYSFKFRLIHNFSLIFTQDLGNNWAEVIGQSSFYSIQTKKKAGIVLILETMKDRKFWIRLNTIIEHFKLPIDTWSVGDAAY